MKQVKAGRRAGMWRLQWSHVAVEAGSDRARVAVDRYFETKGAALKWRDQRKVELRTGARAIAPKGRGLTMQGWFDRLAGTKEEDHRDGIWVESGSTPQTVGVKASRWGKWVASAPIASLPLLAISRDHARAHVRWMKEHGATHATIVDVVGVLKLCVNVAIVERREARDLANPFLKLPLRTDEEEVLAVIARQAREDEDGPDRVVLGPAEAREAMARLTDARRRAQLAVHLLGGMRLSEQMALCAEQIDFGRGVIVVDRAVKVGPRGDQWVGLPKGNKIRLVAMCPTLAAILKALMDTLPAGQRHLFSAASEDKPRTKKLTYATWRAIKREAGLPKGLTDQDCRVSCNNWLEKLCPGVSESTRLEHLGHSIRRRDGQAPGIVVNLRNYTRYIPEGYDVLRREMERVISNAR